MGIKTIPRRPYSPDFWLFPKLRDCRYETIDEMKEAVTKVIDTLTQDDFRGTFQKLLEPYKCIATRVYYLEFLSFMCVLSIKLPIRKKSGNVFNDPHIYHHHRLTQSGRIFLALSRQPSILSIPVGWSLGLYRHWAAVRRFKDFFFFAFVRPCEGVHRSTSHMSSSLLLQQCPASLVRLTLIIFVLGGKWPYNCCFVRCCLKNLFNIARYILVWLTSSFFSIRLIGVHIVHPYSNIDTTAAWKKSRLILSVRSVFHKTVSLSIAVQAFASHVLMSVDETLFPR